MSLLQQLALEEQRQQEQRQREQSSEQQAKLSRLRDRAKKTALNPARRALFRTQQDPYAKTLQNDESKGATADTSRDSHSKGTPVRVQSSPQRPITVVQSKPSSDEHKLHPPAGNEVKAAASSGTSSASSSDSGSTSAGRYELGLKVMPFKPSSSEQFVEERHALSAALADIQTRFHKMLQLSRKHGGLCSYVALHPRGRDSFTVISQHFSTTLRHVDVSGPGMVRRIAFEMLHALSFLHLNGVVHRNLQLDNVLLDTRGRVRLADFGLFTYTAFGKHVPFPIGHPFYLAPELVASGPNHASDPLINIKEDVWSFGVILMWLVRGYSAAPWTHKPPYRAITEVFGTVHSLFADACTGKQPVDRKSVETFVVPVAAVDNHNTPANNNDQESKQTHGTHSADEDTYTTTDRTTPGAAPTPGTSTASELPFEAEVCRFCRAPQEDEDAYHAEQIPPVRSRTCFRCWLNPDTLPDDVDGELVDVLRLALQVLPTKRCSVDELLGHPFFSELHRERAACVRWVPVQSSRSTALSTAGFNYREIIHRILHEQPGPAKPQPYGNGNGTGLNGSSGPHTPPYSLTPHDTDDEEEDDDSDEELTAEHEAKRPTRSVFGAPVLAVLPTRLVAGLDDIPNTDWPLLDVTDLERGAGDMYSRHAAAQVAARWPPHLLYYLWRRDWRAVGSGPRSKACPGPRRCRDPVEVVLAERGRVDTSPAIFSVPRLLLSADAGMRSSSAAVVGPTAASATVGMGGTLNGVGLGKPDVSKYSVRVEQVDLQIVLAAVAQMYVEELQHRASTTGQTDSALAAGRGGGPVASVAGSQAADDERKKNSVEPSDDVMRDIARQAAQIREFTQLLQYYPATTAGVLDLARSNLATARPFPVVLRRCLYPAFLRVDVDYAQRYSRSAGDHPEDVDEQLDKDIPRCHQYDWRLRSSTGQLMLRRIIKNWLSKDSGHRYWQGVDSVCAPLVALFYPDEALASACFERIVSKYLGHWFVVEDNNTSAFAARMRQFVQLLNFHDPELAVHLNTVAFPPDLYAVPWFFTLFAHILPLEQIYELWDVVLLQSAEFVSLFGVAILMSVRSTLLSLDFNGCILFFGSLVDLNVRTCVRHALELLSRTPAEFVLPPDTRAISDPVKPSANSQSSELLLCPRISAATLNEVDFHSRLVVDIRALSSFESSHLPDAIHMEYHESDETSNSSTTSTSGSKGAPSSGNWGLSIKDILEPHKRKQRLVVVYGDDNNLLQQAAAVLVRAHMPLVCVHLAKQ